MRITRLEALEARLQRQATYQSGRSRTVGPEEPDYWEGAFDGGEEVMEAENPPPEEDDLQSAGAALRPSLSQRSSVASSSMKPPSLMVTPAAQVVTTPPRPTRPFCVEFRSI